MLISVCLVKLFVVDIEDANVGSLLFWINLTEVGDGGIVEFTGMKFVWSICAWVLSIIDSLLFNGLLLNTDTVDCCSSLLDLFARFVNTLVAFFSDVSNSWLLSVFSIVWDWCIADTTWWKLGSSPSRILFVSLITSDDDSSELFIFDGSSLIYLLSLSLLCASSNTRLLFEFNVFELSMLWLGSLLWCIALVLLLLSVLLTATWAWWVYSTLYVSIWGFSFFTVWMPLTRQMYSSS